MLPFAITIAVYAERPFRSLTGPAQMGEIF